MQLLKEKADRMRKDKGTVLEYWENRGPGALDDNEEKRKEAGGLGGWGERKKGSETKQAHQPKEG